MNDQYQRTYTYKGHVFELQIAAEVAGDPEVEKWAKEHLEKTAKREVDERPAFKKRMEAIDAAAKKADDAKDAALKHVAITLSSSHLSLIKSLGYMDILISDEDITMGPYRELLGGALMDLVHDIRSRLNQDILQKYWEAQDELHRLWSREVNADKQD